MYIIGSIGFTGTVDASVTIDAFHNSANPMVLITRLDCNNALQQ